MPIGVDERIEGRADLNEREAFWHLCEAEELGNDVLTLLLAAPVGEDAPMLNAVPSSHLAVSAANPHDDPRGHVA